MLSLHLAPFSAVSVAAVQDPQDKYGLAVVLEGEEDAPGAHAEPVLAGPTGQLLDVADVVLRELVDGGEDALSGPLVGASDVGQLVLSPPAPANLTVQRVSPSLCITSSSDMVSPRRYSSRPALI